MYLLSNVQIQLVAAKILENDVPVLVLSFRTQEIIVFRNAKSGEIVYGKEVKEERKQQKNVGKTQPIRIGLD